MPLPRRRLNPVDEKKLEGFMRGLDALRAARPGAPIVLATSFRLGFNYLKLLYYLKKHGVIVALVTGDPELNGAFPLTAMAGQGFFDALCVLNPFVLSMPRLAERYDFDLVHALVGTYSPYPFSELVKRSRAPVIADYIDFRELMYDDGESVDVEAHKRYFGVLDPDLEFALWQEIFTGAAGVIYKDSPEFFEHLCARHGHTPRAMEFQSYVCEEWIPENSCPAERGVPRRIVFAGGLQRDRRQHDYQTGRSTLEVALELVGQGFEFTIFNACDNGNGGFEAYAEIDRHRPGFNYRPALANDRLAAALCGHDLGWNYQHFEDGAETAFCHANVMSSKIFNFLEAGLPIVASKFTACAARFVERHGIGLAIERRELKDFASIAARTDWQALGQGVARARQTLGMKRHFPRLAAMYNQVCGREIFKIGAEGGS
ncbi:MAG: hypothetical protein JW718_02670 [Desulfovibrionaceae bacterium]|nr:hypothetical protein [Desulfovibrionaceae bacterium]